MFDKGLGGEVGYLLPAQSDGRGRGHQGGSTALEGENHDWWFHGMATLGHSAVTAHAEFTQRLIEQFDWRDPEEYFVELTKLKHTGSPNTYIFEFLRLSVMVPNLSSARMIYMFIDGLAEPFRG